MKLRAVVLSLILAPVAMGIPSLAQAALKQATLGVRGMVCES